MNTELMILVLAFCIVVIPLIFITYRDTTKEQRFTKKVVHVLKNWKYYGEYVPFQFQYNKKEIEIEYNIFKDTPIIIETYNFKIEDVVIATFKVVESDKYQYSFKKNIFTYNYDYKEGQIQRMLEEYIKFVKKIRNWYFENKSEEHKKDL